MTPRVGGQPALDLHGKIAWQAPARVLRLRLQGVAHPRHKEPA
jgi:hypothetical protein